jgi:regulator of RNase E activity RraA
MDEGCIGDLTVLEAQASGLAGMIVWGCHRDSAELLQIGFPVFSYGTCPVGPIRLELREAAALQSAQIGTFEVGRADVAFADEDGVSFVAEARAEEVVAAAQKIRETERRQAETIRAGKTLREQLQFGEYLSKRESDPGYTFRKHLRRLGGAIEE